MENFRSKALCCLISSIFIIIGESAYASSEGATPPEDRRICGEYTALSNPRDRELFERHCGTYNDRAFQKMRALVNRLDAKREARAAAQRGDFRLAAIISGPPRQGQSKLWKPAGILCENVDDPDVFIWLHRSDAQIPGWTSQSGFQNDMIEFAEKYNVAMISEPSFPTNRACARDR